MIAPVSPGRTNIATDLPATAKLDGSPSTDESDSSQIVSQIFQLLQGLTAALGEPVGGRSQTSSAQLHSAPEGDMNAGAQPNAGNAQQVNPSQIGLGDGWVQQNHGYDIHTPYNEPVSAHFQQNGNAMHFNLSNGDAPLAPGKEGSRSEYRVKNDYGSGEHLFSADYQVAASPGNTSTIFQIHRGVADPATNLMLRVTDGKLTLYNGKELADVGDRPFNLKVYHNADNGDIRVLVDGREVLATKERVPSDSNYWKFGLYGANGSAEASVSNVEMYSRG